MEEKFVATTADEKARESIIHNIDRNIFVEAGAGSGKTTMLVNRMVAMVESGIDVSKICAITFTKNAALEFYDRFQAVLIDRSNPNYKYEGKKRAGSLEEPNDITRKRCEDALANIDLCFMGTIDSFCNMVLSEHPSEANIPTDARLIEDKEIKEIYKKFYVDSRMGKYGIRLQRLSDTFNKLHWGPEEIFAKLMPQVMERRNVHFNFEELSNINIDSRFLKERKDLITVLKKFNSDLSKMSLKTKDEDPREVFGEAYEKICKGWSYDYTGVIKALESISELVYEGTCEQNGFTTECVVRDAAGNTTLNINVKDEEDSLVWRMKRFKYNVSMMFINEAVPYLEEIMRKNGTFTFFDYLYYLRNMLKDDIDKGCKLINYIYNRHSYFLIDEFQDTNPMQAEIFFYLASETPVKDWTKCKPRDGSLFIVGDPKQSIYRFRNADISSYLNIKKIFKDGVGDVLYLVNNFRSRNIMKNYFNDIFNEVMNEESEDQSKYTDIDNVNTSSETKELEGIYTYETYIGKLALEDPNMVDEVQLANIIKKLVNNPKYTIKDVRTKEDRQICFSDFMIIFASKTNIAKCISTFAYENIPTRVEGKVLFEECIGLKTIMNIYKTVANVDDAISLVSTLKNDVFGFNENDLTSYRKLGNSIRLCVSKEYGNSPIEKALSKLSLTARKVNGYTPSSLFETIMDEYEIFKYVSSDGLETIYYTLELLRSEERTGKVITHEDAINYVEELLSGDSKLERCLSLKQNNNAVHIANLHKVKGLEAPIVILGYSYGTNIIPEYRIEYKGDSVEGYVIKFTNNDYDSKPAIIETNKLNNIKEKEKNSLACENDRLAYVAATRARNVLIINKSLMYRGKNKGKAPNKWEKLFAANQNPFFEEFSEIGSPIKVDADEKDANSLYKDNNVFIESAYEKTYDKKSPSTLTVPSKINDESYDHEEVREHGEDTYSTIIGTMVHRLMEMIIMSKDRLTRDSIVNNIISEYVTKEFEEYIPIFTKVLNNTYDVIHNGGFNQKGKVSQDILSILLNADEVYSEIPFTYQEDSVIWNGIIDLIYRKDNKLHIVDWKTNRNDEDLDEHYKNQLDAYIKASEKMLNEKIEDALIYHIDIYNI